MLILKGLLGDQLSIFLENLHYESKQIFDSIVPLLKKDWMCSESHFHILSVKKQNIGKTESMTHLNFYSEAIFKLMISLSKTKKKKKEGRRKMIF